ncbi:MAG: hypothetical protein JXA20_13255 [Spirochaetes bacterium]|nr:hypothetical protein [Spirochaetota bacterium]
MGTRVLLVYPKIPTSYWSFEYELPFAGKKGLMPPLGRLTVAATIPAGDQMRIIDMNVQDLTSEVVRAADIVLVSSMIVQKDSLRIGNEGSGATEIQEARLGGAADRSSGIPRFRRAVREACCTVHARRGFPGRILGKKFLQFSGVTGISG